MIRWALEAFAAAPGIGSVTAVIPDGHAGAFAAATLGLGVNPPVTGGATRQASVRAGLEAMAEAASAPAPDLVLIHDAARPFVDPATIARVIAATRETGAALAAIPQADTLKAGAEGLIRATVPREGLWRAQTPQGFRFPLILAAHRAAREDTATDDAGLIERSGHPVALALGAEENMKVTTPGDFAVAEALAAARLGDVRTGTGFDVHRFCPGDHVMLCGVRVPFRLGLEGHSDADAGLHALTDAILGALCEADIGAHFPPSDPRWRGADSAQFLRHARDRVLARGGVIAHADVTLICEGPKIAPHREAMRARIAELLSVPVSRISVKATTTERLGFTGRGEGLAAQAAATIRLPL
jgi:2-C-methyl-D-erythritol 4-phosphate cytidylyltransferase/2-C-methyl-D-erythritol 2,4-cyclodiphosphate synthase